MQQATFPGCLKALAVGLTKAKRWRVIMSVLHWFSILMSWCATPGSKTTNHIPIRPLIKHNSCVSWEAALINIINLKPFKTTNFTAKSVCAIWFEIILAEMHSPWLNSKQAAIDVESESFKRGLANLRLIWGTINVIIIVIIIIIMLSTLHSMCGYLSVPPVSKIRVGYESACVTVAAPSTSRSRCTNTIQFGVNFYKSSCIYGNTLTIVT